LAQSPEADEEQHLEAVLKAYDVKRIVIGHTVSPGTIWPRFGGRVVMIDVGLAAHYGGRLACLCPRNVGSWPRASAEFRPRLSVDWDGAGRTDPTDSFHAAPGANTATSI